MQYFIRGMLTLLLTGLLAAGSGTLVSAQEQPEKNETIIKEIEEDIRYGEAESDGQLELRPPSNGNPETSGSVEKEPVVGMVSVVFADKTKGTFRVYMDEVQNSDRLEWIRVSVWCAADRSDLVSYKAQKVSDATYKADVAVSDHGYHTGIYKIEVWQKAFNKEETFLYAGECDMTAAFDAFTATDPQGNEEYFDIKLDRLVFPGGCAGIQFAVWSTEGGEDDLQWYDAQREGESYTYRVFTRNHKTAGEYIVQAFAENKNGETFLLAETTFFVQKPAQPEAILIENVNGTTGSFQIRVRGLADQNVEKVKLPVWSAANQSDIVWYEAARQSNGDFIAEGKVSNHKHHFGTYQVHLYVTMKNGLQNLAGQSSFMIMPKNYLYVQNLSDQKVRIYFAGPKAEGVLTTGVRFQAWSDENGQDDVVWYDAVYEGNQVWSADIEAARHKNSGSFTAHAYINGTIYSGNVVFELKQAADPPLNEKAAMARVYVGSPYMWGGSTPSGWDCSGCTQWIYENIFGIFMPRTSAEQAMRGYALNKTNPLFWKPGDLICFGYGGAVTHVGIYLGNGEMIHALNERYGTRIDDVLWYDAWDSGLELLEVRRVF